MGWGAVGGQAAPCGRSAEDRQGQSKAISQGGGRGTTVQSGFRSSSGSSSSETLAWNLVTRGFASFSNTHPDAYKSLLV